VRADDKTNAHKRTNEGRKAGTKAGTKEGRNEGTMRWVRESVRGVVLLCLLVRTQCAQSATLAGWMGTDRRTPNGCSTVVDARQIRSVDVYVCVCVCE